MTDQRKTTQAHERGEATLRAYELAKHRTGFPTVPDDAIQYMISDVLNSTPDSIFQPLKGKTRNHNSHLARLASVLASNWNSKELHSFPTHEQLERITGLSANSLDAAIRSLRELGLFGVVSGRKTVASEYYPLYHAPSREKFQQKVAEQRVKFLKRQQGQTPPPEDDAPIIINTTPAF